MSSSLNYPYLNFPTIIDITLYKNNYYDNLLVNKVKKEVDYGNVPELKDCYIVSVDDFQEVFYNSFSTEINKIRSLPVTDLQKNATSLYFLDKIFTTFSKLRYVKINVSKEANYSRLNKSDKTPTLFFNYKITSSTIDLTALFEDDVIVKINEFFIKNDLVDHDEFYGYSHIIGIKSQDFLTILSENEEEPLLPYLYELIDPKTEMDDPFIYFITDFDIVE